MNNLRYLANLEIALALAGWAAGLWGVWRGDAAIRQYLYFFAWYPYIVFLDGLLFRLRGRSWLLTQPRKFLRMFGWSVTVWLIFEAHNLALQNWGYVAVVPGGWVRWAGYALAFATVLPGVRLTAQVLDAAGYKAQYNEELMRRVSRRLAGRGTGRVEGGGVAGGAGTAARPSSEI